MTLTYFWGHGVNVNMKFACKHDNSTNINRIGPKLIPWMYLKSVLVKFEDGWPWPIFEVTGVNLNMTLQFSLVNTITQQILIALGLNLYHGCISRVSWLSLKMDDHDLFWRSRGQFKHENFQFPLVNTITQQTRQSEMADLARRATSVCTKFHRDRLRNGWDITLWNFAKTRTNKQTHRQTWALQYLALPLWGRGNNNRIGPKLIPWMYFKSVLVKFEDGWPWPIFEVTGVNLNMKIYNFRL